MNTIVGGVEGCAVYLDEVVVNSNTWRDHVVQIHQLFDRVTLCEANLTINLAKCEFAKVTVTYFGEQVGQGQVR